MADGKTHSSINRLTSSVYLVPTFLAYMKYEKPEVFLIWVGIVASIWITPDLDIVERSRFSLWKIYWFIYGKIANHGMSSHIPFFGTLVRFIYAFWWLAILIGFSLAFVFIFIGMLVGDFNHLVLDLPKGTNRLVLWILRILHFSVSAMLIKFLIQP